MSLNTTALYYSILYNDQCRWHMLEPRTGCTCSYYARIFATILAIALVTAVVADAGAPAYLALVPCGSRCLAPVFFAPWGHAGGCVMSFSMAFFLTMLLVQKHNLISTLFFNWTKNAPTVINFRLRVRERSWTVQWLAKRCHRRVLTWMLSRDVREKRKVIYISSKN